MDLDDLLVRPATEVAALLRNRAVSSRELTEAALRRIERLDPLVNAVVVTCADEALAAAGRADAAVASGAAGALLGLPITVKEAIDVAGLPTTWGNPAFVSHVATTDATVVARLRDAGAIVVGKTNAHAMLGDFGQTFNDVYGATANPWDGSRTPGGSSGGSAAAVAMGFGFLDHGSDLVGSIRIPASFCGVFGLRPSVGVVPLTGLAVPGQEREESDQAYLSTLGPLARSPDDLRAALQATGGPDGTERRAYAWSLPAPRHARLADYRVRVVLDDPRVAPTSAVAAAIARAVEAIAASGATLIEGWPEGVEPERSHAAFGYEVRKFSPSRSLTRRRRRGPRSSRGSVSAWRCGLRGPAASTMPTCSCVPSTSPPRSRTIGGRSTSARLRRRRERVATTASRSGSPTRPCPAFRPSLPRSAGRPKAFRWASRSSVRSTKTTPR
jgi:amidase